MCLSIFAVDGSTTTMYPVDGPMWLPAEGAPVIDGQSHQPQSVLVHLVKSGGRVVLVAMVPDELANCVTNLGLPLEPGHVGRRRNATRMDAGRVG